MQYSGAVFSRDRCYRYVLWRKWALQGPLVTFIGLNPSAADEHRDDPTLRRITQYAKDWQMGGVLVVNLFAFVSTKPRALKDAPEPLGVHNDFWLQQACAQSDLVVAAWGNSGLLRSRAQEVSELIPDLQCLRVNRAGQPTHPLYLPKDLQPVPFVAKG